jgi:WD40 repeat protein
MTTKPTACGDPARLRALLEDRLLPEEQAELTGHLEGCPRCRELLEELAADGPLWDEARKLAGETEPGAVADGAEPGETHDETGSGVPTFNFLGPPSGPGYLGRFGPYDVIEFLGQGGSGMVFKALDPALHRLVAVKVLSPPVAAHATARRRFLREARAAASISHDHVVTIHAVDEANGLPYLVMQYVAGKSLQERINRTGPLELKEILRIGMQAASGLAAAHAQGLIHRDIKPANILLENGIERVKLTDFGLARAVDDASLTQSGLIAGTPQYMAPEQARGEAVDHRADLFALGCVLYAMATGHSPFRARTTMAVLRRVCEETPRPIRDANPEIPPWLAAVVDRLLAKDPAARYASAGEVASILSGHLARLQQAADPAATEPAAPTAEVNASGPSRPPRDHARRRKELAVAAVCIAAGLFVVASTGAAGRVAEFVATALRIRTPEGTLVLDVDDPDIGVNLDGQDVVITGAGPREIRLKPGLHHLRATKDQRYDEALVTINRGRRRLARVELEGADRPRIALDDSAAPRPRGDLPAPVPVPAQGRAPRYVTDLPDVAPRASRGPTRYITDEVSEQPPAPPRPDAPALAIEPPPPPAPSPKLELKAQGMVTGLAYSPDGRWLAALDAQPQLLLHEVGAGQKKATPAIVGEGEKAPDPGAAGPAFTRAIPLEGFVSHFVFSPNGKLLAVAGGDGSVRVWDFQALVSAPAGPSKPAVEFVADHSQDVRPIVISFAFSPDGRLLATGGPEGKARLWDPTTGQRLLELPMGPVRWPITDVRFAPDGKILAVATQVRDPDERGVHLWRLGAGTPPTAEQLGVLAASTKEAPVRLAFSPKTGNLVTYGLRQQTVFWDLVQNRQFVPPIDIDINNSDATGLAFSPDGSLLAVGRRDGRAVIYDAATFRGRATLRADRPPVVPLVFVALAFSPDGKSVATASGPDFIVRIWDVPPATSQPPPLSDQVPPPTQPKADDRPSAAQGAGRAEEAGAVAAARELARVLVEQAEHRLATAQAEKKVAEAKLSQAKVEVGTPAAGRGAAEAEVTRLKRLAEAGSIPQGEVEEAQARLDDTRHAERSAEMAVRTATARLAVASARATEAEAERLLARLNLEMFEGRDPGRDRRDQARRRLAEARVAAARAEKLVAESTLGEARIDLDRAASARQAAERSSGRMRKLIQAGTVPQHEAEAEEQKLNAAVASEKAAQAALHTAQAQLEAANDLVKQAEAQSPKPDGGGPPPARP